jgi:hypothetical protein
MVEIETAKFHGIEVRQVVCGHCREKLGDWAKFAVHLEEEHMEAVETQSLKNEHYEGKVGENGHKRTMAELCPFCEEVDDDADQ